MQQLSRTIDTLFHNLALLELDVADPDQINASAAIVSAALNGRKLTGLVNNAGIAVMGPLAEQSLDQFKAHFELKE